MPHICTTDVLCEGRRGASWCAGSPAGGAPGKERVCQGGVPAESWVSWAGAQGGRDNQDFMVSEVDEGHVQTRMGMGCGVHALIIQVSLPGRKTGSMVGEAPSLGRRGAAVHRGHQEAVRGGWLGGSKGPLRCDSGRGTWSWPCPPTEPLDSLECPWRWECLSSKRQLWGPPGGAWSPGGHAAYKLGLAPHPSSGKEGQRCRKRPNPALGTAV